MKNLPAHVKVYRLGDRIFRVRLDRPEAGASILRLGRWVWAPIPSSTIIRNPHARELTPDEVAGLPAS